MTAADFTGLHLQYKTEQQPGEVPAAIEHDFDAGRMVDHYYVTPSPAFWADEGVQALYRDGKVNVLFTGRIAPNKRQEDVIAAFALYQRRFQPDHDTALPNESMRLIASSSASRSSACPVSIRRLVSIST